MKIRTDFVTNSSSYCTAEVIIDNPVLLEILQKYKDMGLFEKEDPIFSVGDYQIHGDSGAFEIIDDSHHAKTPAFYLYNDDEDEEIRHTGITDCTTPKSLEEVLEKIIELLSLTEEWLDIDVRDRLVEELTARQEEILQAYKSVDWSSESSWDDGDSDATFTYNQTNGSNFESRNLEHFSEFGEEGDDETDEE